MESVGVANRASKATFSFVFFFLRRYGVNQAPTGSAANAMRCRQWCKSDVSFPLNSRTIPRRWLRSISCAAWRRARPPIYFLLTN